MKALGKGSIASIVKLGLDIAWVFLWIAAVAMVAAVLIYTVVAVMGAAGALAFSNDGVKIGPFGIRIETDEGAIFDWRVLIPVLLVGCATIGGFLAVVWRLKKLFQKFIAGEPFAPENARHLRAIWIILVALEIARWAILFLFGVFILAAGVPKGFDDLDFHADFSAWFLILVIVVLAEVFREGARLHEEQKLTI